MNPTKTHSPPMFSDDARREDLASAGAKRLGLDVGSITASSVIDLDDLRNLERALRQKRSEESF